MEGDRSSSELGELANRLYAERPKHPLYHYTSISGLLGIVEERALWASEIRYLNDAQELQILGSLVARQILIAREGLEDDVVVEVYRQFGEWLKRRLEHGPLVFVGSLTEDGNLLSQWRGYCPHGQGVSLGFAPDKLITAVHRDGFAVGKCIYDTAVQTQIVVELLDRLVPAAKAFDPKTAQRHHPTQSFHGLFDRLEGDILRIAALLKDSSYREEREWRAVSPPISNYVLPPIRYRAGTTMLVPFLAMPLPALDDKLDVPLVFIGPTPTPGQSLHSVAQFLSKYASQGLRKVSACAIPHRG